METNNIELITKMVIQAINQNEEKGNANEPQQNDIIAKINAQRLAQNKKW